MSSYLPTQNFEMATTHLAAVCPGKGQPFVVQSRDTPKPGPNELLVAVKSVALNPADAIMRDQGLFITTYPTVTGFDMSGLVLEVGNKVPEEIFLPGITRVAVYSASVWKSCDPDYGVFQERCLVPWQHAVPLPDKALSWDHAATLPVAVQVPLSAWDALEIPRLGEGRIALKEKKEALLIWGASSSVGTMGVQTAQLLCEDFSSSFTSVYATAGLANTKYVASLGADRIFDYKDARVVENVVSAAKRDGLVIRHCFLATGDLAPCQQILNSFVGGGEKAKIASAPLIPPDAQVVDGVETIFLMPSSVEEERLEQFRYWMSTWLLENLGKGAIRPSPEPKVVGNGLAAINYGLDMLLQGVSCTKLVVEVAK